MTPPYHSQNAICSSCHRDNARDLREKEERVYGRAAGCIDWILAVELTCFTLDGWNPRIRPASSRRDWMEATHERFAYRCLPLAIANAHGWEILSPCGFEARWNGGMRAEDVEIRLDPGAGTQVPVSIFGQATLTFHVEGILRTPPGFDLWVGGSPNSAKDGIAPLGGVVETDWSPYTFTMNWRFTRPDHWIRFEENEPFCFFFPIERALFEEIEPRIRSLDEAPDLKEAFQSWSASRNAFQKWVTETNPVAPSDRWQKLYYRGLFPNGDAGAADHRAKLRTPAFINKDGTELRPVPAVPSRPPSSEAVSACPVKPATTAPKNGMDTSGTPAENDLKARRQAWALENVARQRTLSNGMAVDERTTISPEDFLEHFYARMRPLILRGAIAHWPAVSKWTPEYLKRRVGSAEIEFQGGRNDSPHFELYKDNHKRRMPFDGFMDLIAGETAGNDAYLTAYNSASNRDALAPLDADLGVIDDLLTGAPGMLWIGPGGTFTPLHFDLTNNLLAQVVGVKHLVLLPPSETEKLANNRHVFSDVHDVTDPDQLLRHPDAATAVQYEVTLTPGDILYIPVGWWHQVVAEDFSAMLTYTDFRWPNDAYERFPTD